MLSQLSDIFTPDMVHEMNEDIIDAIAAETEESKVERKSSTEKLSILEKTLSILKKLDRHRTVPATVKNEQKERADGDETSDVDREEIEDDESDGVSYGDEEDL